jgi:uncharacterized protein YjbJ (UPF0337 family)
VEYVYFNRGAVETILLKEKIMNKQEMQGDWKQLKGKMKEKWGKLTDDDLTKAEGRRDQLIGRIQERYGIAKEEAEKQYDAFRREQPELVGHK